MLAERGEQSALSYSGLALDYEEGGPPTRTSRSQTADEPTQLRISADQDPSLGRLSIVDCSHF